MIACTTSPKSKAPLFLGHAGVEDDLQKEIAKFLAQIGEIVARDCIGDFVGFLQRIGRDGRKILRQIPRTSGFRRTQSRHDVEEAADIARRVHDTSRWQICAKIGADPIRLRCGPANRGKHAGHGAMAAQEPTMPVLAYVESAAFFVAAVIALFASAGTFAIPAFWMYLAIFAAVFVASFIWVDPDLARERMRPGGKKPPAALRLFSAVLLAHWIIAGLDRGRFHWSDNVPGWLQALGLAVLAAAYALCFWAMHENRFFSSVIRIQTDRGQYVVTTGPYAVIRHPGYTAGILVMVASGIALGSWLSAAFLVITTLPFLLIPGGHRGPRVASRTYRLPRLRRARSLAAYSGRLVRRAGIDRTRLSGLSPTIRIRHIME